MSLQQAIIENRLSRFRRFVAEEDDCLVFFDDSDPGGESMFGFGYNTFTRELMELVWHFMFSREEMSSEDIIELFQSIENVQIIDDELEISFKGSGSTSRIEHFSEDSFKRELFELISKYRDIR